MSRRRTLSGRSCGAHEKTAGPTRAPPPAGNTPVGFHVPSVFDRLSRRIINVRAYNNNISYWYYISRHILTKSMVSFFLIAFTRLKNNNIDGDRSTTIICFTFPLVGLTVNRGHPTTRGFLVFFFFLYLFIRVHVSLLILFNTVNKLLFTGRYPISLSTEVFVLMPCWYCDSGK